MFNNKAMLYYNLR